MKTKEMDAHSQQKRYQLCNVRDQISKKIMTLDEGNKIIFSQSLNEKQKIIKDVEGDKL